MLDRLLNALMIMLVANFIWSPLMKLGEIDGWPFNPVNAVIAIGVWFLLEDIADFQRSPRPRSVLLGAILSPFWLVLRPLLHK
jgi:hypothetical protein